MALNDYIMCSRCDRKLIYDGDKGNREWWVERFGKRFGKKPEILCPPCQDEAPKDAAKYRRVLRTLSTLTGLTAEELDARLTKVMEEENGK